jgi:hypothetical protein
LRFRVAAKVRSVLPTSLWTPSPGLVGPCWIHASSPVIGVARDGALPAVLSATGCVADAADSPVRVAARGGDPFWFTASAGGVSEAIADIDVWRRRPGRRWNEFDRAARTLAEVAPRGGSLRGWDRAVRRVRRARGVDADDTGLPPAVWARAIVEFGAVGVPVRATNLPAEVGDLVAGYVAMVRG